MLHILEGKIEPGWVFDRTVGLEDVPDGYRAMDCLAVVGAATAPLTIRLITFD